MGKHSRERMTGLDEEGRLKRANKRLEEEKAKREQRNLLLATELARLAKERAERAEKLTWQRVP